MISLIPCILGTIVGILVGLIPGSHVNNFLPILLSLSYLDPYFLALFIVSFSVSQIIISYVPSIFLGAPNEDTALSILPGHRMLIDGKGIEAVKIMMFSSVISVIITVLVVFVFFEGFKTLYYVSRPYVWTLIILVILFMVMVEKTFKKVVYSISIILLSGTFGIFSLNFPLVPQTRVMFPILSGMFGLSTILISIGENTKIPKQKKLQKISMSNLEFIKSTIIGSIFGIIVGFLPAIGVSQAAIISQTISRSMDPRSFLASIGSINLSNEIFSIFSLYLFGNPRSGSSVAIQRLLNELEPNMIMEFLGGIILSVGIAVPIGVLISKKFLRLIEKIDYKKLNFFVFTYLLISIVLFSGIYGMLIGLIGMGIGILSARLGVKRSDCMGVLLIPSLLFFTGTDSMVYSMLGI